MNYLLRRFWFGVIQLTAISFFSFLVLSVAPGDYFSTQRLDTRHRAETVERWRREAGLGQSLWAGYGSWFVSAVRGEFGQSLAYRVPVSQLLRTRAANTIVVVAPAVVSSWILGLAAALYMSRRRFTGNLARVAKTAATASFLVPEVITASVFLWAAVLSKLPSTALWIPVIAIAWPHGSVIFLHACNSLERAWELPYVRLAAHRGIRGHWLLGAYVLRAAANPLISLLGLSVATAAGTSLVVESVTGRPGIGPLFLEAVRSGDYPIVQTVVVLLAALLIVSNWLADLLLYWLDPRLRLS